MPGIWYEIQHAFKEQDVDIGRLRELWNCSINQLTFVADLATSFFVGGAAGRKGDHSSSDRKWALNIGIPFYTPEVCPHTYRF